MDGGPDALRRPGCAPPLVATWLDFVGQYVCFEECDSNGECLDLDGSRSSARCNLPWLPAGVCGPHTCTSVDAGCPGLHDYMVCESLQVPGPDGGAPDGGSLFCTPGDGLEGTTCATTLSCGDRDCVSLGTGRPNVCEPNGEFGDAGPCAPGRVKVPWCTEEGCVGGRACLLLDGLDEGADCSADAECALGVCGPDDKCDSSGLRWERGRAPGDTGADAKGCAPPLVGMNVDGYRVCLDPCVNEPDDEVGPSLGTCAGSLTCGNNGVCEPEGCSTSADCQGSFPGAECIASTTSDNLPNFFCALDFGIDVECRSDGDCLSGFCHVPEGRCGASLCSGNDCFNGDCLPPDWYAAGRAPFSTHRGAMSHVSTRDGLLLAGGLDGNYSPLDNAAWFDLDRRVWLPLPPLPDVVFDHGVVFDYVFGGQTDLSFPDATRDALHQLSGDMTTWEVRSAMPGAGSSFAFAPFDGTCDGQTGPFIAVHGGQHNGTKSSAYECYSPASGNWAALTSPVIPSPEREGHRIVDVGGEMMIGGGWDAADDARNDLWFGFDDGSGSFVTKGTLGLAATRYGMVYDDARGTIVLFANNGGEQFEMSPGDAAPVKRNDIAVPPRGEMAFAWVSGAEVIVMVGGFDGVVLDEVQIFEADGICF
jgi:hypothetical protein